MAIPRVKQIGCGPVGGLCGHLPIHQLATVDRTSGIISAYLVEKQC